MANNIVQELVTILSFKTKDGELKKYERKVSDSMRKMEAAAKRMADKLSSGQERSARKRTQTEEQAANRQMKITQRLLEYELRLRATMEQKKRQQSEKGLEFELKLRARIEQLKRKAEEKAARETEKNAEKQRQLAEKQAALELRLQEKLGEQKRKLQEKADRDRAKAEKDLQQDVARKFKSGGKAGMDFFGGGIMSTAETAADIEKLLNKVQAFGNYKKTDMPGVEQFAKSISENSAFNMLEILEGFSEMGKAGYKGNELKTIMKVLPDFATASDTSFDQASVLATDMMTTFGYKTKDIGKVTDILSAALNESKLNFSDLTYSLKYSAPSAKRAGMSLEQLSGFLAILSQSGIKGSTGGTGMRTALTNLSIGASEVSGNKKARKKQKETAKSLGLDVYDKNDNFDYLKVVKQLGEKFKGMKKAKQTSILYDLFGKTGQNQAGLIIDAFQDKNKKAQLEEIFRKITMENAGTTKRTAGVINQGSRYDEKQLQNSWILLKNELGKGVLPVLSALAKSLKYINDIISNMNPGFLQAVSIIMMLGFAISAAMTIVGSAVIFFAVFKVALAALGVGVMGVIWPMIFWTAVITGAITAVVALGINIYNFCTGGKNAFTDFANYVNDLCANLFNYSLPDLFDNLVAGFNDPINSIKGSWLGFIEWFKGTLPTLSGFISSIRGMFGNINISPTISPIIRPAAGGNNFSASSNVTVNMKGGSNPAATGRAISTYGSQNLNKMFNGMSAGLVR